MEREDHRDQFHHQRPQRPPLSIFLGRGRQPLRTTALGGVKRLREEVAFFEWFGLWGILSYRSHPRLPAGA